MTDTIRVGLVLEGDRETVGTWLTAARTAGLELERMRSAPAGTPLLILQEVEVESMRRATKVARLEAGVLRQLAQERRQEEESE